MENVFLIGGSGFIGKNLVNKFRQNYEVHVIDKFIDEKFFSERPEVKTLKMDFIGWTPKVSADDGISRMLNWLMK